MAKAKTEPKEVKEKDPWAGWNNIENRDTMIYTFSNGVRLEITDPIAMQVTSSGGHKIVYRDGLFSGMLSGIYVQPKEGWYMHWNLRDGQQGKNPYTF